MADYSNSSIQPGNAMDVRAHPTRDVPDATQHYWGDSPSERPFAGVQKSNIPEADQHPNDPWNKAFKE